MRIISWLLAALFRRVTSLRNTLYDRRLLAVYRGTLPVVSVGNVTVGGNGKTPLCQFLAADLKARGMSPVILSRGYGGHIRGPYRVTKESTPAQVGDEPCLLAATTGVPVFVARSRVAGVKRIEEEKAGNVVILDDGLQHRALGRDFEIISVFVGSDEGIHTFLDGALLPLGRFREERSAALHRADAIVLSERRVFAPGESLPVIDPAVLHELPAEIPVFRSYLESSGIVWGNSEQPLPRGSVSVFAGIASPEGFFDSVRRLGYAVLEERSFPDHHTFSVQDIQDLKRRAGGNPLVCTEKDFVKLCQLPLELREGVAVLKVFPKVVPADAFGVSVHRACRRGQQSTPNRALLND